MRDGACKPGAGFAAPATWFNQGWEKKSAGIWKTADCAGSFAGCPRGRRVEKRSKVSFLRASLPLSSVVARGAGSGPLGGSSSGGGGWMFGAALHMPRRNFAGLAGGGGRSEGVLVARSSTTWAAGEGGPRPWRRGVPILARGSSGLEGPCGDPTRGAGRRPRPRSVSPARLGAEGSLEAEPW